MSRMVGIDLVHIPEFEKQLETGGKTFIQKAFQINELKNRRPEHLAGLWAAKEAVMKAATITPKQLVDVRIARDKQGKLRASAGFESFAISIAHHGDYAVAVAIKVNR